MSSQPATQGNVNRGNLPKGACYKCGKTGHWSRDCTAPREEWIPQQPRDAPGTTGDAGDVDPEASTQNKPKKKSTRAPKFTVVDHLLGPNGLAYLHDVIPEKFNEIAKGPGHEFGDFQRLMGLYKEWTRKMYPYKPHEWVMNRVKVLSKTKEVRACVRELNERERIELGGDGVDVPEDFNPEDVVFPDADPDDDDEGKDVVFPDDDDDDEEEWNEAKHGEKARKKLAGGDEDDELAELMRESNAERKGKTKGKKAVEPKGADSDDEEPVQSQMEDMGDAFDEARKTVGEGYFDESSDDDDEGGIAVVNTTRRKSSALGAGEKGKARKKLKEVAAKRRRKKKEPTPEPEPEPEAAEEEPEPARKKLRRRAKDSDSDDVDEDDEEEEAGANRRARRRVVKRGIESDSDDDLPIPQHLGGTMLAPSPAKPLIPSFLYESDDEKKTETKE